MSNEVYFEKSSKMWQKMKKSHQFTNQRNSLNSGQVYVHSCYVHDCNQSILVKCIFEDFQGPIQFKLKICSLYLYKKLTISYNIWNFIKFEFECILTLFSMFLNISIALLFCKTTTMNACKYISFICYLGPRYLIQILKLYFNL